MNASAVSISLEHPWAKSTDEVLSMLEVDSEKGLSSSEVRARLQLYGPNAIARVVKRSALTIFIGQFKSLIVGLLGAAAGVSLLFGDHIEAMAIFVVILANAFIGFVIELQATRSVESLRKLVQTRWAVRRNGDTQSIVVEELAPGDIVLFDAGDLIGADVRIISCSHLQTNESILTGEAASVAKDADLCETDTPLYSRSNMLFKGTVITNGSGIGVVTGTGMNSELGNISTLVEQAKDEITPLERRLDTFGRKLIGVMLCVAAVTAISGILAGKSVYLMLQTAIALTVAAIPEGLPIVATIALARGMRLMAKKNALVNKLSAVETLGATAIICTDKTGTLTENRMEATTFIVEQADQRCEIRLDTEKTYKQDEVAANTSPDSSFRTALEIGVLCNNASIETTVPSAGIGDPMEIALLLAGARAGLTQKDLEARYPEVTQEAFDAELKMMASTHRDGARFRTLVKGALEEVLHASHRAQGSREGVSMGEATRERWQSYNDHLASRGLRVLAFAEKYSNEIEVNPYCDLTFVGLVGLEDPPRSGVKDALAQCDEAGIRAVMVTGDQAPTAVSIAKAIGLLTEEESSTVIQGTDIEGLTQGDESQRERIQEASIFARVSPKQKLELVSFYQKSGNVVAMTGDGVNDAPALKKADVGVAMGLRGTEAAREASDMVLKDDSFGSIVAAVEEGRIIFNNIRTFVIYLMSCNLSEILVVGIASAFGSALPLLPLQILFLNLVTDVFPALALGMSRGTTSVMQQPPRSPAEEILERRHWNEIVAYSLLITCSTLSAFSWALQYYENDASKATTVSFLVLAFAQLWHVFNVRDRDAGFFESGVVRNIHVWAALAFCTTLILAAVYVPLLALPLKIASIDQTGWFVVILASTVPCILGQGTIAARSLIAKSAKK